MRVSFYEMKRSVIAQKEREDMIQRCQRMTPEERLVAFAAHSQLMTQLYYAGVQYRARRSSSKRKRPHTR